LEGKPKPKGSVDFGGPTANSQPATRKRRSETSTPFPESGAGATTPNLQSAIRNPQSEWVEVDWDTALDVVAGKFSEIKRESGGDALAVLTSAKCTNEENYLVNKLTRQVLGTNSIDHCARL
jgi:hypothetical protein